MALAPRFVKYQTGSNNYIYDPGTNEIVCVGEVVYKIVDDYRVLDTEELVKKHAAIGEADVRRALEGLDDLQSRGILCDCDPRLSSVPEYVECRGEKQPLEDLLNERRRLLVLELTERCNLRCDYCCYGEQYPTMRGHGQRSMSLEMAKRAITDFLSHRLDCCCISFYGGEPLLEFELLKQVVLFANSRASERGLETRYSMSTNGTLLTDEKIRFLVEHRFNVMISLDGPKETHDRCRVFRDDQSPDGRRGSYDVVMKNMQRFVELFPEYTQRGILATCSAVSDFDEANRLFGSLQPRYPHLRANFIREHWRGQECQHAMHVGATSGPPCAIGGCIKATKPHGNAELAMAGSSVRSDPSGEPQELPAFLNWTAEGTYRFWSSYAHFLEEFCRDPEPQRARESYPLSVSIFHGKNRACHKRSVSRGPVDLEVPYRCFPGASRTFYSVQGGVYPCERTETGDCFRLGELESGVDVKRAVRLLEAIRLQGDCGNCVARRLCTVCPALVTEHEGSGKLDSLVFQEQCKQRIEGVYADLREYTAVMEKQPQGMEVFLAGTSLDDWVEQISFSVAEGRQAEPGIEELEDAEASAEPTSVVDEERSSRAS